MIEPDKRIVKLLQDGIVAVRGEQYRNYYTIRWDDTFGHLCVVGRKLNGTEFIDLHITDDEGNPRQAAEHDVADVRNRIYGRNRMVDRTVNDFFERKEKAKAQRKETLRDAAEATAKEMARVARYGLKSFSIPEPKVEEKDGFTVVDHRRQFEEVAS